MRSHPRTRRWYVPFVTLVVLLCATAAWAATNALTLTWGAVQPPTDNRRLEWNGAVTIADPNHSPGTIAYLYEKDPATGQWSQNHVDQCNRGNYDLVNENWPYPALGREWHNFYPTGAGWLWKSKLPIFNYNTMPPTLVTNNWSAEGSPP
jgi:hypothetical protein